MKVLTFHFSDTREESSKHKTPDEDFLLYKDDIFAVFDGIPLLFKEPYPTPSPVREASEVAAQEIYNTISTSKSKDLNLITKAFKNVNSKIKEFNKSLGITKENVNHLDKQYASVVGAFGFLDKDILYFGQINDSGVMLFDQLGNREVDFILNQQPFIKYVNTIRDTKEFELNSKEEHVFIRKTLVNNDKIENDGKRINFGIMNGDERAINFLKIGASNLAKGQVALFYTDGFIPFVYDENFIKVFFKSSDTEEITNFIKNKETEKDRYKKEKSLIVIKF